MKLSFDGIRALATRTLIERGYKPDMVRMQFAHHERTDTKATHDPWHFLPERKVMMNEWAAYLYRLMDEAMLANASGEAA